MKKFLTNFVTELKSTFLVLPIGFMSCRWLTDYLAATNSTSEPILVSSKGIFLYVLFMYMFFAFATATCNEKYRN